MGTVIQFPVGREKPQARKVKSPSRRPMTLEGIKSAADLLEQVAEIGKKMAAIDERLPKCRHPQKMRQLINQHYILSETASSIILQAAEHVMGSSVRSSNGSSNTTI